MFAAVAYFDEGISVLSHEEIQPLLLGLAEVLFSGQDGWTAGVALRPETFDAEAKTIAEDDSLDFEQKAEAIMEMIQPFKEDLSAILVQVNS